MPWAITIALGLVVLLWFIRRFYLFPDLYTLKNIVKESNISYIYISSCFGRFKVSFTKRHGQVDSVLPKKTNLAEKREIVELKSLMVGTFHWSRSIKSGRSFGRIGKKVKSQQVVGIIEALTLKNEVFSPVDGKIIEVKVENGNPVEYGQTLALIEKKKDSL